MTDLEITQGNKLIAEFMNYVESPFNVFHHSSDHGFAGTLGYRKPFIQKDQYNLLVYYFENDNRLGIDNFYEDKLLNKTYLYDNKHLFLSAYNNRKTCLDWMPNKLTYHSDYNKLMEVVDKIEETNRINDVEYYPYSVDIWKNCCKISDGNNANEICVTYAPSKIEAVWLTIVEFIKWCNINNIVTK